MLLSVHIQQQTQSKRGKREKYLNDLMSSLAYMEPRERKQRK